MKRCRQCAAEIPAAAKLCRDCKSFQDWRAHVPISQNVFALILAAFSVAALGLPPIAQAIRSPNSNVVLSNPVAQDGSLYLIASNSGERPGVIQDGFFSVADPGIVARILPATSADTFVPSGAKQVRFNIQFHLNAMDAALASADFALKAASAALSKNA